MDRCGKEIRYVIDYYHDDAKDRGLDRLPMPSAKDKSVQSITVNVRPASDSLGNLWERSKFAVKSLFAKRVAPAPEPAVFEPPAVVFPNAILPEDEFKFLSSLNLSSIATLNKTVSEKCGGYADAHAKNSASGTFLLGIHCLTVVPLQFLIGCVVLLCSGLRRRVTGRVAAFSNGVDVLHWQHRVPSADGPIPGCAWWRPVRPCARVPSPGRASWSLLAAVQEGPGCGCGCCCCWDCPCRCCQPAPHHRVVCTIVPLVCPLVGACFRGALCARKACGKNVLVAV